MVLQFTRRGVGGLAALFLTQITLSVTSFAGTLYVDDSAVGADNGTGWTDAYRYLQDALMMASAGDEIRVAQGVYRPDEFALSDRPSLGRFETFALKNGVAILGGYAGFGADNPDARNVAVYPTILSGDLEGNDPAGVDLNAMVYHPDRQDNAIHVVVGTETDSTAVLEGCTITGGNANVPGYDGEWVSTEYGGGLYNAPGDCIVRDCLFVANSAQGGGGVYNRDGSRPAFVSCVFRRNVYAGMYNDTQSCPILDGCVFEDHLRSGVFNYTQSHPVLIECRFSRNGSEYEFGGGICSGGGSCPVIQHCLFEDNFSGQRGGALYFADKSNANVTDSVFRRNRGTWYGGAVFSELSSPVFQRCIFEDNVSNSGGAFSVGNWSWYEGANSEVKIENCLFRQNRAIQQGPVSGKGGAISANIWQQNRLLVTNCTFAGNTAPQGRALLFDSFMHNSASEVVVKNCILWDGGDEIVSLDKTVVAEYSNIQGGFTGSGNLNDLPMFVDTEQGDFRLMSNSPCVDKGDNAVVEGITDLSGHQRIQGKAVDMGAYEVPTETRPILYVDDTAPGLEDGSRWDDAFTDLQDVLAVAVPGQEIRVAQGVYRPADPNGSRESSFVLKGGVAVRGGYAGFGAANPDARDIHLFESILSGDLDDDDYIFSGDDDNHGPWRGFSREDNSENVVLASGLQSGAVLEGFTISGGQGRGGLICDAATGLEVHDCLFRENMASAGGGLQISDSTKCRATHCVFTDNYATYTGGGVYLRGQSLALDHCLILGNQAEYGGGVFLENAAATIVNCTVAHNLAWDQWGGVAVEVGDAIEDSETSYFLSCIFWGNTCSDGNDEWAQIGRNFGNATFDFCCVQGWTGKFAGVGSIDQDPLFIHPGNWDTQGTYYYYDDVWFPGDYHLQSQGGRWDASAKAWVQDAVTSPCIDAGDPGTPIMFEPFPNGGVVNMGAYGGTAEASKSYFGKPVCEVIVAGDINGDCTVDLGDFAILARHWLEAH